MPIFGPLEEPFLMENDWLELAGAPRDWGWPGLYRGDEPILNLRRKHPNLVFPGVESSVVPINIVPYAYQEEHNPIRGDVIPSTAWTRGLSPRPIYASQKDRNEGRLTILFIHSPLAPPNSAMKPTTLATLKLAMKPYSEANDSFSTSNANSPRGVPLEEAVKMLNGKGCPYEGMVIQPHPSLLPVYVCIRKSDALPAVSTFTELMDAITLSIFAHWDWYGDKRVCIMPRPDYPNVRCE